MHDEEPSTWPADGQPYSNLATMPEEDFSNFLDLENLDFSFSALENNGFTPPNNATDHKFSGYENGDNAISHSQTATPDFQHNLSAVQQEQHHQQQQQQQQRSQQNGYPHYQWSEQQYRHHNGIPPTPNSSEMYPTPYHQQTGAGQPYNGHQSFNNAKENAFTPLTSPQFIQDGPTVSVHDYAMADPHILSPLTSPAIYAQQGLGPGGPSSVPSVTTASSMTGSPIDMDLDTPDAGQEERPRKTRKKEPPTKQLRLPTRKRKDTAPAPKTSQPPPERASAPTTRPASTQGTSSPPSISPQPQVDNSMPPPPLPSSAKSSPYIFPNNASNQSVGHPPATPASLMRLAKAQNQSYSDQQSPNAVANSPNTDAIGAGMEELVLPEAATPSATAVRPGAHSVRSTPAILPKISSIASTPVVSPRVVPYGNTSKNPAGRGGSRKRNSTSSTLISPAIRPRISPSIKPLLPENGRTAASIANDERHAILLASKSNYQNLLEGNHLPGVVYPSELSTNLTSKRTSHKLAEQGRRNRINTALQEMQTLLPASPSLPSPSPGNPCNDDSGSRSGTGSGEGPKPQSKTPTTPAQVANSKAATVELAIEYIKNLTGKLEARDAEIEALKQRLSDREIAAATRPDAQKA